MPLHSKIQKVENDLNEHHNDSLAASVFHSFIFFVAGVAAAAAATTESL
jgi:hypothetical protein